MANPQAALLIVIGEPVSQQQIGLILHRVIEGLSAWNHPKQQPEVDLSTELRNFLNTNVAPENLETGGTVLRYPGPNVYVEIQSNPGVQSLRESLFYLLTLPANYKHIIHAGPAVLGNGSWILQDGTWSAHDFIRLLHEANVTTALTQIAPGSSVVVSCFPEGEWNDQAVKHHGLDKLASVQLGRLNGASGIDPSCGADLQSYLQQLVVYTPLDQSMASTNVTGSVRFRRPTLHIFPAGQGDAALFGVSGFTVLLDGGFNRKTCFWDFLRHVDRVDALLISRLSNNNAAGVGSFVDRLSSSEGHPKLGYVFGNIPAYNRPMANGGESSNCRNPLLVSLQEEGAKLCEHLARLNLKPQPCAMTIGQSKHPEPLTLYQKVGQGRLDMYVLNPSKDSKEMNEFMDAWKKGINKQAVGGKFSMKPGASNVGDYAPPLTDQTSIGVLLVWRPADPNDQIVRVLYPGSCSQEKILAGLEKLKHLDFLKHSICTPASLEGKSTTPTSTTAAAPLKKPLNVKPSMESPRVTGSVSPNAAANAATATTPKAISAPKGPPPPAAPAAAPSPKAAEVFAHDQPHHPHHQHQHHAPIGHVQEKDLFELSPSGDPLLDMSAPPPPSMYGMMSGQLGAFSPAEADIISREQIPVSVQSSNAPLVPERASPEMEKEDFIHRQQQMNVGGVDLLGGLGDEGDLHQHHHRHHAGHGISAEPMHAEPFESVEPNVLRFSHDQLQDYAGGDHHHHHDHSRMDEHQEPSPVSPKHGVFHQQQQHTIPAEPSPMAAAPQHPDSLPLGDHEKFGGQQQHTPESPLLLPEVVGDANILPEHPPPPHSPNTQQRLSNLNPEAPAFVPLMESPTVGNPFGDKNQDPFGGDGHAHDGFRNGSSNPFDNGHQAAEGGAAAAANPFGDGQHQQQDRKKMDDIMKEWGEPLGLPTPTPAPATKPPGAAAAAKPKPNGPVSGAGAAAASSKTATSSTTTTAKRTSATSTTSRVGSAVGASPKSTSEPKTASSTSATAATKKSPTSATATKTAAAASAASKPAAAKPAATAAAPKSAAAPAPKAAASKPTAATSRPTSGTTSTTTAAKSSSHTAAPTKSAAAGAKKPGPPGAVYYVDLAYIPHQGNPHYVSSEFFKHVRSKHYVLSTLRPNKDILESLLVGKKSWNLPEEEVTLIPTYDSDTLSLWMQLHKDELASESIDVAPSCSRCTVNLEEHQGAKCAAYRLEL